MHFRVFALLLAMASAKAFAADASAASTKWQAAVPKVAESSEGWADLLAAMAEHGMPYGALSGARAMLNFSTDLKSKELAFRTIIHLVDLGMPLPTRSDFVAGDIEPSGADDFAQSYALYKSIVNREKHMDKWTEYYLAKVDKNGFAKFLYYQATLDYLQGKFDEAITGLKKALAVTKGPDNMSLAKKEARTLARIYYERGDYGKSLEIYQTFLLRMNPIEAGDWIEAAWNLYKLKRFPEAMGLLYNLESRAGKEVLLPEKYVLRGLINREYCSNAGTDKLIKSFDAEFGATITGIKSGEPLGKFPLLNKVDVAEARKYRQLGDNLARLQVEAKRVGELPRKLRDLATYVYNSEIPRLEHEKRVYQDEALEAVAKHLVLLSESLRFLRFDVAREKYSPDRVFAAEEEKPPSEKLIEQTDELEFRLHWLQWGDFWRDERLLYKGLPKSKCVH